MYIYDEQRLILTRFQSPQLVSCRLIRRHQKASPPHLADCGFLTYRRGGAEHELQDEIAAQQDAARDAEEAAADGDERVNVRSFDQRAVGDATYDAGGQGSLSDEFAEKEGTFTIDKSTHKSTCCSPWTDSLPIAGAYITRQLEDPKNMDLKAIARKHCRAMPVLQPNPNRADEFHPRVQALPVPLRSLPVTLSRLDQATVLRMLWTPLVEAREQVSSPMHYLLGFVCRS
jgi:hypothetical protein